MLIKSTMQDLFEFQDSIVIRMLQTENNFSLEDAVRTWMNSKTKYIIQNVRKMQWLGGNRCHDELLNELNDSDMWLEMPFE